MLLWNKNYRTYFKFGNSKIWYRWIEDGNVDIPITLHSQELCTTDRSSGVVEHFTQCMHISEFGGQSSTNHIIWTCHAFHAVWIEKINHYSNIEHISEIKRTRQWKHLTSTYSIPLDKWLEGKDPLMCTHFKKFLEVNIANGQGILYSLKKNYIE